ncbi:hypothetical protein [Pseudalkalibacillus caeni]|uniref:MotA/TolQ/ExbB proton channel domain-containing protein n=1 Tax=Exobacillus caeni TaxID=2574798 RepID=A0A5R9FFE2_9BACL|nr:hypothetical protein [Pseudalkalibacillus caeni]TLS39314.1 hypothetical protein FCL54_03140 [Pseudalkalibacillus caeni]
MSYTTFVVLCIIGAIALFGFIGHLQVTLQMKSWLNELERVSGALEEKSFRYPWIQQVLEDYRNYHLAGISPINTQALVEKYFFRERVPLFGFFRIPVGSVLRLIQQLPPASIVMGILGTFIGLTLAITSMQETLLLLGDQSAALSLPAVITAISAPFKGMSVAFVTSIAGIGNALFLTMLQSGFLTGGRTIAYYQEKMMTDFETLLDFKVNAELENQKPRDSLEKLLDRLVSKIQESFQLTIGDFGRDMVSFTDQLKQAMEEVQNILETQRIFSDQFSTSTNELLGFGENFKKTFETMDHIQQKTNASLMELGNKIKQLEQQLKQSSDKSENGYRRFEQFIQRSDGLLKETQKKTEELSQLFLRGLEEQMQRYQQSFDEHERRNQQQQDEWFYRYQEKQNHYGRASEDFSESVNRLEKAWYTAIDKLKRETFDPMFYKMEREPKDNHLQHEFRNLSHSLDSLYQGLSREFKDIQHYLGEVYHLMHRMYEERARTSVSITGQKPIPSQLTDR